MPIAEGKSSTPQYHTENPAVKSLSYSSKAVTANPKVVSRVLHTKPY